MKGERQSPIKAAGAAAAAAAAAAKAMSVGPARFVSWRLWFHEALQTFWNNGVSLVMGPEVKHEVRVARLDGTVVILLASHLWTTRDAKVAMERESGLPPREQRLVAGTRELEDHEELDPLFTISFPSCDAGYMELHVLELTLLRRDPVQAEWLERVKTKPLDLRNAPEQVRVDREVALAAAAVDSRALEYVGAELWQRRSFAVRAVALDWCVWERHLPKELKEDVEIVMLVLGQHGKALQNVPKSLCDNPQVLLSALHERPKFPGFNGGALETLMSDHASFVFKRASPQLCEDSKFMLGAVKKDWQVYKYGAPCVWDDRSFVMEVVRNSGMLLERASGKLRGDRELVLAAMAQNSDSLKFAAPELWKDREVVAAAAWQLGVLPEYMQRQIQRHPILRLIALWQRISSSVHCLDIAILRLLAH